MKEIIHVSIIEDDDEIRQTLSLIINGTDGFYCKHTFVDCESAMKELPGLYVNIVLMDIELPGISGIEGVKMLKPKMPDTDFIMLTVKQDDDSIFNSLCVGATGYLLKDTAPVEILRSIREVKKGGSPMSTNIARRIISSFQKKTMPSPLSDREAEILGLLCDGMNYRSIADKIFLSSHTVKSHIKNIYRKLHVNNRAEAVKKAIRDKLI